MSVVDTTVSQSPAPDNSILPTPPLSDGTIFMYGITHPDHDFCSDSFFSHVDDPEFKSTQDVLTWITQAYKLAEPPQFVERKNIEIYPFDGKDFDIYQYQNNNAVHHVYVWAITPMGGAA